MWNRRNYLQFIFFLLFGHLSYAQVHDKMERIQMELEKVVRAEDIPAVSIGILYQDSIHFINSGYLDRSQAVAVQENSIYQIASLGKIFIGILSNHLLLEGQIQLDQAITDFLPPMFAEKRWEQLEKITIEQLLHHQAGLPQDAKKVYRRKDGEPYLYDYSEEHGFFITSHN